MKVEKYEVVVILHPELEKEAVDQACDKIKDLIIKENGKVVDTIFWGKRKLAYDIEKNEKGIYVIFLADIPTPAIKVLTNKFNIMQEVLRFMFSNGYKIKKMPIPEENRTAVKEETSKTETVETKEETSKTEIVETKEETINEIKEESVKEEVSKTETVETKEETEEKEIEA